MSSVDQGAPLQTLREDASWLSFTEKTKSAYFLKGFEHNSLIYSGDKHEFDV